MGGLPPLKSAPTTSRPWQNNSSVQDNPALTLQVARQRQPPAASERRTNGGRSWACVAEQRASSSVVGTAALTRLGFTRFADQRARHGAAQDTVQSTAVAPDPPGEPGAMVLGVPSPSEKKSASTKKLGAAPCAALVAVALAAVAALLQSPPSQDDAAATKPFTTFPEFYPFYLTQHAHPTTKLLHLIGSSGAMLGTLAEPRLLVGLAVGSMVGLLAFRLTIGIEHGLVEFGLGIVACLVCTRFTCGSIRPALRTLVFA